MSCMNIYTYIHTYTTQYTQHTPPHSKDGKHVEQYSRGIRNTHVHPTRDTRGAVAPTCDWTENAPQRAFYRAVVGSRSTIPFKCENIRIVQGGMVRCPREECQWGYVGGVWSWSRSRSRRGGRRQRWRWRWRWGSGVFELREWMRLGTRSRAGSWDRGKLSRGWVMHERHTVDRVDS